MITYNNIVTKFEEFVENHFFLKTFTHGSPSDVDLDKFETYPLLHLVYTGGNYGENSKTYNLELYILDFPPSAEDKVGFQKSAISNSEQVAEDILADIKNGGDIFQFGYYYEVTSANITPLEEVQSNVLAGTLLNLAIEVAYEYDACNNPLTGLDPEGTEPQPARTRGLLLVRTEDNSVSVPAVATIVVSNNSLSDDGSAQINLATGSSSSGQTTIWKGNTSEGARQTLVGLISDANFGTITSGQLSIDSTTDIRAGWAIGTNPSGSGLQCLPVSSGSQVSVEVKYEIVMDADGLAVMSATPTGGVFPATWNFTTYTTAGTHTETVTSGPIAVAAFQLSNTFRLRVSSTVAGSVRIHHTKITITHA